LDSFLCIIEEMSKNRGVSEFSCDISNSEEGGDMYVDNKDQAAKPKEF